MVVIEEYISDYNWRPECWKSKPWSTVFMICDWLKKIKSVTSLNVLLTFSSSVILRKLFWLTTLTMCFTSKYHYSLSLELLAFLLVMHPHKDESVPLVKLIWTKLWAMTGECNSFKLCSWYWRARLSSSEQQAAKHMTRQARGSTVTAFVYVVSLCHLRFN